MNDQTSPAEQQEQPTFRSSYFSFPSIDEENNPPKVPEQSKTNFDFSSISKMALVFLTSCNETLGAFFSIFSVSTFEISAKKSEAQRPQKNTGLLSNMLTFFKSLNESKSQPKNTEPTTSHKT